MACFAVYTGGKQVKVFSYNLFNASDYFRAKSLAIADAGSLANYGYPAQVEDFGISGIGCTVFNSDNPFPDREKGGNWGYKV